MKRFLLLITALLMAMPRLMAEEPQTKVYVSNAAELIAALGSNRMIVVTCDIDFENKLNEIHEFNPRRLPEDDKYAREALAQKGEYCFIYQNTDGPELVLSGYKNLTIKSISNQRTLLRITPRYAYVLNFVNCEGISIEGMVMGHTEAGYCDGGVLSFEYCRDITIKDCDLYGCGTEGLGCLKTERLKMVNTMIRDCTYSIMTLKECKDFAFENCYFLRNKEYLLFELIANQDITFRNCLVAHNLGTLFSANDNRGICFDHCNLTHDLSKMGMAYDIEFRQCIIGDAVGMKGAF